MARRAAAHPSDAEGRVLSHLRALLQPRVASRQQVTSPSRVAAPGRASNTGPCVGVEGVYGALDVKSGVYMGRQMSDVGRAWGGRWRPASRPVWKGSRPEWRQRTDQQRADAVGPRCQPVSKETVLY